MAYPVLIESDDIVSDPFEDDRSEQPQLVSDYSDDPAESSSPAAELSEDEQVEEEYDGPVYQGYHLGTDEELEDEEEDEDQVDEEEDEDQQVEDEFEQFLRDEGSDSDMSLHSDVSPARTSDWISDTDDDIMSIHSGPRNSPPADRYSEAPSDDLFVDQRLPSLPPIADFLPEMRRTIARTMEAVQELQSAVRRSAAPAHENHRYNARHHPYHRNGNRVRDELVAVEMQPARGAMRGNRAPAPAEAEVIDLTGEPDSPAEPRERRIPAPRLRGANASRHPRRHASLSQRTPSLSRSDGSLLGNNPTVIDLTMDDPPAPPPLPQPLPRRNHHNHNHHRQVPNPLRRAGQGHHIDLERDGPFGAAVYGIINRLDRFAGPGGFIHRMGFGRPPADVEVQILGGAAVHMDPLAHNLPDLDYRGNGGGGDRAPKPAHVAPPPAREGFTRDTDNGDDGTLVCPGCEEELHYDPEADKTPAAKKARTRKDQEEHHFWALKDCGHVYCRECYERRRSSAKTLSVNFRRGGDNGKKLFCAVDDCPTDVTNKANWVGLFL